MEKIYQIYALSTEIDKDNYRYIGVTSRTLKQRLYQHKYSARKKNPNLPVHKWIKKYNGKILITLIENCFENNWAEREQYWISFYKTKFKLTNISKGGNGIVTKEMRSVSSQQRSIDAHKKKVYVFNLDGTLYKEFSSIKEASIKTHASITAIGNVLHGRAKTANGYYFSFNNIINFKQDCSIKIYEYNLNKELICIWNSLTELGKAKKLDRYKLKQKINSGIHLYKDSYYYLNPIN